MEDITDADYTHAKRVGKDFEMINLGECHDKTSECCTVRIS